MTEAFSYPFMQRALVIGLLVGTLCAVLSVYVVLKRWAFIGQGISHAAFGGVALGLLLGVNVTWTSIGFCLMTAYLIGITSRRGSVSADSAIGIFLTASMALGVLFIWMRRSYTVDVFSYLFGNILATDTTDLWTTLVVGVIVLGFVALFYKELWYFSYDPEMARVTGVPVDFLYYGLLTLISLTVVVAIRVVGLILVSALLILPAATARPLSTRLLWTTLLSVGVAVAAVFVGLWVSYAWGMPSGATIVLSLFAMFLVSLALAPPRRASAGG
jgi:ABC-type Mn2+/Zn2+ transport system permease subunit